MFLLALVFDTLLRARLARAIEPDASSRGQVSHRVRFLANWPEAWTLTARSAPDALVFAPPPPHCDESNACVRYHAAFPSVVVLAYGLFGSAIDMADLAERGIRALPTLPDEGSRALRGRLERALEHGFRGQILRRLEGRVGTEMLPFVRYLLDHTREHLKPEDVAPLQHCDARTLRERLHRAGLPATHHLIIWARLLHVARLLDEPGRSVQRVGAILGYPPGPDLGNQFKRYVGITPTEARRSGAFASVLAAFLRECDNAAAVRKGVQMETVHPNRPAE